MEHAYGLSIPKTLEEVCDPARMAFLVYDMQVGILSQIADGAAIVARVAEALDAARTAGMRVFFSRHLSLPPQLMGVSQWRTAMAWQRVQSPAEVQPWFLRDTPGFGIVSALAPRPDEAVFDKLSMSAFEGTYLNMALRDCGINAFAVAGIALEIGIDPTTRHGSDLGYIPVVLADACGAGNQEAAQRSLAGLAFTGDALLTDTAAFCRALQQAH